MKVIKYEVYGLIRKHGNTNVIEEHYLKSFSTYEEAEHFILSDCSIYPDNVIKKVYRDDSLQKFLNMR